MSFPAFRVHTKKYSEHTRPEKLSILNFAVNKEGRGGATPQLEPMPEILLETFRCPLYQTTFRLSKGATASDKVAIEYFELQTEEPPRKWVKRAVALIMEVNRGDLAA